MEVLAELLCCFPCKSPHQVFIKNKTRSFETRKKRGSCGDIFSRLIVDFKLYRNTVRFESNPDLSELLVQSTRAAMESMILKANEKTIESREFALFTESYGGHYGPEFA